MQAVFQQDLIIFVISIVCLIALAIYCHLQSQGLTLFAGDSRMAKFYNGFYTGVDLLAL